MTEMEVDVENTGYSEDQLLAANTFFSPMVTKYLDLKTADFEEVIKDRTKELVSEEMGQIPPQKIEVYLNDELISELPRQHYVMEALLKLMACEDRFGNKLNIALVGPTGTGKTRLCINVARALDQEFILQPFNPHTTKSDLMGYMDANGNYVESPFYKAFKEGRLFIADEFDAANPASATILNAAVSNRNITFPNGETVEADPDFRAVFCMNTYGTGGDDRYTGRSRLDMATLDRLVFLEVPIDPGLEAALIGIPDVESPSLDLEEEGVYESEKQILHDVVTARGEIEKRKMRYSVSPRVAIHADAMTRAGFGKKWVKQCCLYKGMNETDRNNIDVTLSA